jgi:hypothetical protein
MDSSTDYLTKSPFGSIEFLRNRILKTDGPPNVIAFALVFRN